MRARTFLFITLYLLCHPQLWTQTLTKQLPPASDTAQTAPSAPADLPDDPSSDSTIPEAHIVPPPPQGTPVKIEADTQTYAKTTAGGLYILNGHVVIHYKTYVISADHANFNQETGDVEAKGNLHIDGGPDDAHLVASHGTMNLEAHRADVFDVNGTLGLERRPHSKTVFTSASPFTLSGKELIQNGQQNYHIIDGTMTSCSLPNPDWQLIAHNFFLNNGVARGKNSVFDLLGFPLIYLPYVTHPVGEDTRTSGLLIPITGSDSTKGIIIGEEIYFVLGRSADMTIGAEYFSSRGFSPMAAFRYKGRDQDFFTARFHALLDRLPGTENQGGVDILADGRHDLDPETRVVADVEYLSSYTYRQAFEENYATAINSEVKSQAFWAHSHNGLTEGVSFNRYQSFEANSTSSTGEEEIRINHLPILEFDTVDKMLDGTPLMWGMDSTASGLSRSEPGFETSRIVPRLDIAPHVALPVHFGGWTLRPVVGLRDTFYGKSQNPAPLGELPDERDATLNRKDFEGSVDLRPPALERDFSAPWLMHLLGGDVRHTIEPDVEYRYVTGIDNFKSVLRFDDADVASDTSELTYSLTQRLFLRHVHPHPCKGDEALGPEDLCGGGTVDWLTWQVGQKYYFKPDFGGAITNRTRNVLDSTLDLTGVAFLERPRDYSPVISRLRWSTTSNTDLEWDVDYDTKTGRLDSSNVFATYHHGDYNFSMGDAHQHALDGATAATTPGSTTPGSATSPATEIDFNQLRFSAVYGGPTKLGPSLGTSVGYDFTLSQTQYAQMQASYNWDCCGISFELRHYSLGSVRNDTEKLYSITLANVGSAGSLKRALRVF
ncbi:LPS-assembly protein LptD [Silvibacterium acidisoli]|uniref:LPS-assembly protein LptD n=1 Tax=Acidobacteriaceae bacterium ZG23-2 TaxID=2883246 RepID=UPI00406C07EF